MLMPISEMPSDRNRYWRIVFSYWLLVAAVLGSTLAFGSVELWSMALIQFIVSAGLLVFLVQSVTGQAKCYKTPGMLPLLMILLYMILQSVPVPPSLLKVVSPAAFEVYSSSVFLESPGQWVSVSLFKRGLVLEFFRFASYAGVYFLTVEVTAGGRTLKQMVYTMAIFASVLAALSIIANFSSGNYIMWLRENPWGGHGYGPYINKNHYAGFMGMALPLIIGLFLATRPRAGGNDIKSRIVSVLGSRRINMHVLFGIGAVAVFVSILLSLSRSAVISMLLSITLLALLVRKRRRIGKGWVVILSIAIAISIGWFGVTPLLERFESVVGVGGITLGARKTMFIDSMDAARDFFLTGGGFGAFAHIYPAYRTLKGSAFVDHAHNDYLEFFVEGGLVFALLFIWFVASVVRHVSSELPKRHNRISVYMCLASVSGIFYMLLHSLTDFNLHVGANGLFFFFLLGLMVSASSTSLRGRKRTSLLPCTERAKYSALVLTLILGSLSLWFNSDAIRASAEYRKYTENVTGADGDVSSIGAMSAIRNTVSLDSLNPVFRVKLAASQVDAFEFDTALLNMKSSLLHSPLCGLCLQSMAAIHDMGGEEEMAREYLESSLRYGARWTDKYLRYALWLSASGGRDEALRVFAQGMSSEPGRYSRYIKAMADSGYSFMEMSNVLPQRYRAFLLLAGKAVSSENKSLAGSLLDRAFELISKSDSPYMRDYNNMYYLNSKLGRYRQAYNVAAEGTDRFDDNPYLLAALGREFERRGELQRAMETYREVLILQPFNGMAARGLKRLDR
jgi:O-antigen ligase